MKMQTTNVVACIYAYIYTGIHADKQTSHEKLINEQKKW